MRHLEKNLTDEERIRIHEGPHAQIVCRQGRFQRQGPGDQADILSGE